MSGVSLMLTARCDCQLGYGRSGGLDDSVPSVDHTKKENLINLRKLQKI